MPATWNKLNNVAQYFRISHLLHLGTRQLVVAHREPKPAALPIANKTRWSEFASEVERTQQTAPKN